MTIDPKLSKAIEIVDIVLTELDGRKGVLMLNEIDDIQIVNEIYETLHEQVAAVL